MASGMRFGQYELGARLAAGGMGEVFIARRRGAAAFEKEVALKLLLPHLADDQDFVTRFFDEARLAARMNHPNIVQIFDVGEVDGRPYLAMALIEGVSLSALLRAVAARREMVPMPLVRLIAIGLLEALAYAHGLTDAAGRSLHVIHRDVSPSNVLLSSAGAVFLNDFGLAKATTNVHATRPGTLRGKAAYVAPEQLDRGASPVTRQTDLFSAGVTLYHLLTLVSPFWRPSDVGTMQAVLREPPQAPNELRPDVGPAMAQALERALAKSPGERFISARAFREAFVDGPVASAPELGDYVASRCAPALAAFTHAASAGSVEVHTASLGLEEDEAPVTSRRRWPLLAATAVGLVVLGALGWWVFHPAPAGDETAIPEEAALRSARGAAGDTSESGADTDGADAAEAPRSGTPVVEEVPTDSGAPLLRAELPRPPPKPAEGTPSHVRTAAHPRPAQPGGSSERRGDTSTAGPPVVAPVRLGYLTADARPWAAVLLDGREVERTPVSRFPIPAGRHQLVLRGPQGQVDARSIVVEEGQMVTVRADFGPKTP